MSITYKTIQTKQVHISLHKLRNVRHGVFTTNLTPFFDIMALGVGAYFGEGAYLKKYGIPKPLRKIDQQKVFRNDLYAKQDFKAIKNIEFLMVVNRYFSERFTQDFLQKGYIYRFFYFSAK